jgi:hypothetical protein
MALLCCRRKTVKSRRILVGLSIEEDSELDRESHRPEYTSPLATGQCRKSACRVCFGRSSMAAGQITIPVWAKSLTQNCFGWCGSLSAAKFESKSGLSRMEQSFRGAGLFEIMIPGSIESSCENCFGWCESLSSMIFESGSRLSRIKKLTFCKVDCLKPSFLYRLNLCVKAVFVGVDHFHR